MRNAASTLDTALTEKLPLVTRLTLEAVAELCWLTEEEAVALGEAVK